MHRAISASITPAAGAFLLMPGFPTGAIFFAAGSVAFGGPIFLFELTIGIWLSFRGLARPDAGA